MFKEIHLSILFLFITVGLSAQTELTGRLVDTTKVALLGANVVLLQPADSSMVTYSTTDNKGVFSLKDVGAGQYIMQTTFMGYERPDKVITITASDQYIDFGDLTMYPAGYLIKGVQVTADRIPVQMRGDTMMFDAEAFAVGENAVVEDLIRRLPGMQVDGSGNITYRGRPINEVLINGKPFFAGNATLLTQNLDADAIKNLELFDQKSDAEEISGVDDGEENITINLEMKEKAKAKMFGELYGGYGTQDRFQAGGKTFRISDATQMGVLGTINNINRVGFSGDEISAFNGSTGRGRGRWWENNGDGKLAFDDGNATGDNQSIAAGINYGTSIGENGQFTADYALFDRTQLQLATTLEAFNRADDRRIVETIEENTTTNYSHRIGFELRQRVDSTSRLRIRGNVMLAGGDNTSDANTNVRNEDNSEDSFSVQEQNNNRRPSGQMSIRYNKGDRRGRGRRERTNRRTFGARAYTSFSENRTDLELLVNGIEPGLDLPGVLVNGRQVQNRLTDSWNMGGGAELTEPIAKKWRLNMEVRTEYDRVSGDFAFQLAEQNANNNLERSWTTADGAASLIHNFGKRSSIGFGTRYQGANLTLKGDEVRDENFTYVLPFVRFRRRFEKGLYGANIRSSARVPSISQLQTIADPNASGRVSVGNPELNPALNYSYNSWLWYNNEPKSYSINGSFDVSYTDNAFGNEVSFLQGQQIFRTINVSHAWRVVGNLGTTIGIKAINTQIRLETDGYVSRGEGIVDEVTRLNTSSSYNLGGNINTEINEKSYVQVGYRFNNFTNTFSGGREDANTTQLTDNFNLNFELEVSPKWRFESRFVYAIFRATEFSERQTIPDLVLSLELRPFKEKGHFIRLSGSDLFNQNTIINRNVGQFSTTETRANGLGRYFLATFHYKI
ncbi:MAG: carboxypeptidase regulatory-like domain-containing protein [Bacteroidota bacterium]